MVGVGRGLPEASLRRCVHRHRFVWPNRHACMGSGFRVQGSGFRVQGSGFRVQGSGFRVQGSGYRVQGSGFRVQGSGSRVHRHRFVWPHGHACRGVGVVLWGRIPCAADATTRDLAPPQPRKRPRCESGQLRAVHLSRHKWPRGLVN